ncbi:MAG: hypothetical protein LBK41_08395 [Clostridiales bacterium]|nr:hypothetical protein [Clostridiales bacterium]
MSDDADIDGWICGLGHYWAYSVEVPDDPAAITLITDNDGFNTSNVTVERGDATTTVPAWIDVTRPDSNDIAVITNNGVYDAGDCVLNVEVASGSYGGCKITYSPNTDKNQHVYVLGGPAAGFHQTWAHSGGFDIYNTTSADSVSTLVSVDAETGKKTALTLGLYFQSGVGPVLTVIRR